MVRNIALLRFCEKALQSAGLKVQDAAIVADSLVESNLRGIDSHGVARLSHYLNRIEHGSINARPKITTTQLGPSLARVDGDHGLGQLVMNRATQAALDRARETGAGWASVCHSSHCGSLDYFGLQIARAGMIGFAFTHVDPMVLPYGSKQPFCGTNPLCITAPGEDTQILCLDMATSVTPWNQIANAVMEGLGIPLGWAVDGQGAGTTDPKAVTALFPLGEYKGSGLGLMIDVLCALLSGAPYGPDIPKMYGDPGQPRLLGGLVGAIDIARFLPLEHFQARASKLIRRWNALPPVEPGGRVLYPGEPETLAKCQRLKEGIPIPLPVIEALDQLAGAYKIDPVERADPQS